jgi:hypothetical protein
MTREGLVPKDQNMTATQLWELLDKKKFGQVFERVLQDKPTCTCLWSSLPPGAVYGVFSG